MDVLFLQGPSGSGKTALASHLAEITGREHLDRDEVEARFPGQRQDVYRSLAQELQALLEQGRQVIVDAPFFDEDDLAFASWIKEVGQFSYLLVSLKTPAEVRRKRRQARALPRDQVSNWPQLLRAEEESYQALRGSLLLPGSLSLEKAGEMLLWHIGFAGREIKKVGPEDVDLVQKLKEEILEESFAAFLYQDELRLEQQQVASPAAVLQMIEENEVFLASKEGQPWALLALSPLLRDEEGKRYRKIFSGYSRGRYAASAIGLGALSRAYWQGLDYLLAHVYRDNEKSQEVMTSFGFRDSGSTHNNPLVPRIPIEHWVLPLK